MYYLVHIRISLPAHLPNLDGRVVYNEAEVTYVANSLHLFLLLAETCPWCLAYVYIGDNAL